MIVPDGVQAAADRELEFHPTRTFPNGKTAPISAWSRRATTIEALVDETNALRKELDELKARLESIPF